MIISVHGIKKGTHLSVLVKGEDPLELHEELKDIDFAYVSVSITAETLDDMPKVIEVLKSIKVSKP